MSDQEAIDRFYWSQGPCCAGCDWWRGLNSHVGLCVRSTPVAAQERGAMIGVEGCSLNIGAGHVFTPRDHHCGQFEDGFDWSTLPLAYQKQIGAAV